MAEQPAIPRASRHRKAAPESPRNPLEEHAPWKPAPYTIEQVGAIQALARGDAKPHQQQIALAWIINEASGTYDEPYRPGVSGERDTTFALGRAFVGRSIVKLTKLNTAVLQRRERNG